MQPLRRLFTRQTGFQVPGFGFQVNAQSREARQFLDKLLQIPSKLGTLNLERELIWPRQLPQQTSPG
jgi:hypothetical protein